MISTTRIFQLVSKSSNIRLLNTTVEKSETPDRIWSKVVLKNKKDGRFVKLRVQSVPKDRFEDFIDLKMNHFVKDEITYKVSGVNNNPEALKEYREILSKKMMKPSVHKHVYLIDDETKPKPELIAASSMELLYKNGPDPDEAEVKTKEMKRFFEILQAWNQLYTYDEVFKRYGVDCFYQDIGFVVHPKYRLFSIGKYEAILRPVIGETLGVAVTGAWSTMLASQLATIPNGWETLFEVSYEELATRLGIQFPDPAPSCKYIAIKVV